jgi:hypothetical protein
MKKKEYIILAVIIVLLGGYLFLRNTDRSRYALPAIATTSGDNITRIEITASGETIRLDRIDDQWQIGDQAFPADSSEISEMLSVLEKLTLTALVSESGAYPTYDLTDEKKIDIRAWADDRVVRNFAIGKTANTYQHTFVLIGNDPNVYHADGNFRQTFDQSVAGLRDKTALSFTASEISGIDILSDGKFLSLSLENPPAETSSTPDKTTGESGADAAKPVWMIFGGGTADEDAIERLLSQLAYLNCSGYLDDRKKEDFSEPVSTITLKGAETYTLSLYKGEASETDCPAVSSQNEYPFILNETACSRLSETLAQILDSETDI